MERLERFYKIDRLLKDRKVVSFAAFMQELGMSRASVKRDLEYMRSRFNAPIEYDPEANGYRFGAPRAGPRYELPGLWFSSDEAYALLSMHSLLAELEPGLLEPHVAPLQARLRAILGGEPAWKDIEKRIRVFQPGRRAAPSQYFGMAAAAVLKRSRLWIRHYNRKDDRETAREISPQRLVHYRDNWYVDAYCHLREDLRSFAVDAIRAAELRDTRAKEIPAAELDEHLGSGYGIFAGRDVAWAVLRFTREAARWVSAQSWHPKQRARFEAGGAYVLEIPYAHDRELLMEILKFGADVEVLGPEGLRARVAEALRNAARRYDR
ncbi:MAG TPA: WYL domain-containing protein [Burkholderiales bacterium]|jgi:predicted DNA-binding transcriptional regulator YafY|nr:WYL domain-containing protein [Burkholderiales bacterium]